MQNEIPPVPPQDSNGRLSDSKGGRGGNSNRPSWWPAEYKLAKKYLHGDEDNDIPQDFEQARELLLSEAEQDNPLAMCDLGRMCTDGLGGEPNADEAHQWYAKALVIFRATESAKPWKYTEYRIGKMYAAGLGTEQDYETAAHCYTKLIESHSEWEFAGIYADEGSRWRQWQ